MKEAETQFLSHFHRLQVLYWLEAGVRRQSWELNPSTVMRDTSILTARPNTCSTLPPNFTSAMKKKSMSASQIRGTTRCKTSRLSMATTSLKVPHCSKRGNEGAQEREASHTQRSDQSQTSDSHCPCCLYEPPFFHGLVIQSLTQRQWRSLLSKHSCFGLTWSRISVLHSSHDA